MVGPTSQPVAVLVWGGGTGGVAAALQASRSGARTLLLTPGSWLGGMVSAAGVCCPDGNELTPWQTGLWGALLRSLAAAELGGLDHNWVSCFGYRPATAEGILRRWVAAESLLTWWPGCRVLEVARRGTRISELTVLRFGGPSSSPEQLIKIIPELVIDGSDRGDLFPLAAAPFRLGWEGREIWGEPSAPTATDLEGPFFVAQPVQSPTWVVMGQLDSAQAPSPSALDPRAKTVPPPTLPAPFQGACDAFGVARTLTYGRLPGGAVMLNWPLEGNDWHEGLGRAFLSVEAAGFPANGPEQELAASMKEHSRHFARVMEEASGGSLKPGGLFPTPEQASTGALEGGEALALMPYWREGRRLVGLDLVLEQHLLPVAQGASIAALPRNSSGGSNAIAVGNYANDHHYPGADWPLAPKSCRWGGRWSGTPFTIPYGALVSRDVENLLAADKCISVSHMANGATRLQPLVLNIGQAAGLAAALCVRDGLLPAELPVGRLQEALIHDPLAPAGPFPVWSLPWHHPQWADGQRAVLSDPDRLDHQGNLLEPPWNGMSADPFQAPLEATERLWQGDLVPDGSGGFALHTPDGSWPVITLEPALHRWLLQLERPTPARLVGCANPWGRWLRVSRLAGS
jgi:hypothetical protein